MNSCKVRGAGIMIGCRSSGGPRSGTASPARMAFLARILSTASPAFGRVYELMHEPGFSATTEHEHQRRRPLRRLSCRYHSELLGQNIAKPNVRGAAGVSDEQ